MGAEENLKTVQMIYEAFSRGDIAAVLEPLTDDVDFAVEPNGPAPWHGLRRGKEEVGQFFQALAENVEITEFTPLAFAASDTDVMVVIRYAERSRATGKSGDMDLHHWWRFRDGKIWFVRGTEDTLLTSQLLAAV
jgi:ketosteroid isomerase-like protein